MQKFLFGDRFVLNVKNLYFYKTNISIYVIREMDESISYSIFYDNCFNPVSENLKPVPSSEEEICLECIKAVRDMDNLFRLYEEVGFPDFVKILKTYYAVYLL